MFEGKIKRLVYNHHDDVDGWELDDGTFVHFPPHVGHELSEWVGEGDRVTFEGDKRTNRNGDEVVFPTTIESQGWSLTFEDKKPPRRHDEPEVTNADIMRELSKIRQLIERWSE